MIAKLTDCGRWIGSEVKVRSLAQNNGDAASVLRVWMGVTVGEEFVERSTLFWESYVK
jgi:hypothetical protein